MNEQTHTTQETLSNETHEQEINSNANAEQTKPETNRTASGQAINGQVDFEQMYNMLTERDKTIEELTSEVAELKKTNTSLLLKVNASASAGGDLKNPYESFVDLMAKR